MLLHVSPPLSVTGGEEICLALRKAVRRFPNTVAQVAADEEAAPCGRRQERRGLQQVVGHAEQRSGD